ncbi:MAG: antibiotic biosynthesis monooxygenase [Bacteroidales bacterium]|nr:antibiotic biosynthesis monooxygenase [Bacteroidales bacterium]
MIATFVHVWVKPEFIDAFVEATIENHKQSVKEPGNLRFDILRDATDPAKFVLYEAYMSDKDLAEHKNTAHYQQWRDTVADWMAQPRQGIRHDVVFPTDRSQW